MNICIFGDSITEGYYDEEKGGWVNRVKEKLNGDKIYNFGISGDTTEDLLGRFYSDINNKNPDMNIFAIGVNDSEFSQKEKRNLVDFNKFKENISRLIEKSKKFTKNIIFIGLVSVDEIRVSPIPWNLNWHYLDKDVEKYDRAIKEICDSKNIKFIDIYNEMKKVDYEKLLSDGIHPNSEGHKWIAEKVIKELNF